MAHGKHRKQSNTSRNAAALASTGGLSLAALGVLPSTATAAPMSDWERVAQCESNSDWNNTGGDGGASSGGIQFQNPSWSDALSKLRSEGIDTSGIPGYPANASKDQQILAGEALLALQGPSAWAVTVNGGAHCGNAAGGALASGSVFNGGPSPFGDRDLQDVADGVERAPEPAPAPAEGETHTVKAGETLWGISGGDWRSLYERNAGVIGGDPDLIKPGQVLKLKASAPKVADPVEGWESNGYRSDHPGIDWAAKSGTPVVSAKAGTVALVQWADTSYGNRVVVDHGGGVYTRYAHLSSIDVSEGQSVSAGTKLGGVGSTGNSTGPHLHFEVTHSVTGQGVVNPLAWLNK